MNPKEKTLVIPLAVRADVAAKMLGIGRTSLHHLMKSGKIPYTKLNRAVLFRISDLDNFLQPPPEINSDPEGPSVVFNILERMSNNG